MEKAVVIMRTNNFVSIDRLAGQYLSMVKKEDGTAADSGLSFQEVLKSKTLQQSAVTGQSQRLRFSKHAAVRLADRNIELSTEQLERLEDGARKAGQKGIKDSLVIVDELAFIVNIPNSTVVTAMDSRETDESVFTNINGAVIM